LHQKIDRTELNRVPWAAVSLFAAVESSSMIRIDPVLTGERSRHSLLLSSKATSTTGMRKYPKSALALTCRVLVLTRL
jgi:hypothetical protein